MKGRARSLPCESRRWTNAARRGWDPPSFVRTARSSRSRSTSTSPRNNATGGEYLTCEEGDGTGARYLLAVDAASSRALSGFSKGDEVRLTLHPTPVFERNTNEHHYRVLGGSLLSERSQASSVAEVGRAVAPTLELQASSLADAGRYYTGVRRIRLLSIIIAVNGHTADYAGSTAAEREAWALEQRKFMDEEMRFTTYGKLGFDMTNSRIMTADLGTQSLSASGCSGVGFELCQLGAAQLSVASMSNIDGVFYYLPEAATPACGSNGWGTLGICAVGLLTRINNPSVDNAVPPYSGINRNYGSWNARCFARYQRAGRAARANIGIHEFGHYLGMGHAGGSGHTLSATGSMRAYGDNSAIMGNDAVGVNSFTASTRFFLGTLPESELTTNTGTPQRIRALSLGPDEDATTFLSLVVPCSSCMPRVSENAAAGRFATPEVWITFRGDQDTCNPEHVPGTLHGFRCHRDHAAMYNYVYIHFSYHKIASSGYRYPGTTTERWFWIRAERDLLAAHGWHRGHRLHGLR